MEVDGESTAPTWASEPCLLGIDEAGRGPVLGPMVYGVAFCPLRLQEALKKRNFADSKTLNEEKREALYSEIEADTEMRFEVDSISANAISTQMLRRQRVSLNTLANESTFGLVQRVLDQGVNLKEVYCDTVGDAARWQAKLTENFPAIKFVVCPKADSLYPIVSAASIVAKVTRDRELRRLINETGTGGECGSGYPGDPLTVAWLAANLDPVFGYPDIVRFSWQTTQKLLDSKGVKATWECDEDFDASQKTLTFGGKTPKPQASSGLGRHSFFSARKLQRVENF